MLLAEEWMELDDIQATDLCFQIVRQLVADLRESGFSHG